MYWPWEDVQRMDSPDIVGNYYILLIVGIVAIGFHAYNKLVPQDTGNDYDAYVKNLNTGAYTLASLASNGSRLPGWNEGG